MEDFLEFYEQQKDVLIREEAVQDFANRFLQEYVEGYEQAVAPLQFPLQFPSLQEELNLLALKELLMVGGMFEKDAHTANQQSLNEVVLFGLIGAFLTENSLNATFMRGLSASDVANLFSLPITEKEDLPQEHQDSGLSSLLTMEKRGALADYADMLANVAYHAGTALKDNSHPDLSSLLEKENLEDKDTSLEQSCRGVVNVIQSLDDRHFVSVKRAGVEHMIELPFLKNARRMVYSVFLKRCDKLLHISSSSDDQKAKLCNMVAAPSVRTINTLLSLGILARKDDAVGNEVNNVNNKIEDTENVNSSAIGNEVSMRCAAVVACWKLSAAITQILSSSIAEHQNIIVSPIQLSLYLDSCPCNTGISGIGIFCPIETGQKW